MRLLLIRHGQSDDNVRGVLGSDAPGPDLSELGRSQAAALPGLLADEQITAIYASTLVRTQQTATPLAQATGIDVQVVEGLEEISAGLFDQQPAAGSARQPIILSWWQDASARIPGGESGAEFFGRFDRAIAGIAAEHEGTVAVVTHGAAIRTWVPWVASNLDLEYSRANPVANATVVALEGSPTDGWVARSWSGALLDTDACDQVA